MEQKATLFHETTGEIVVTFRMTDKKITAVHLGRVPQDAAILPEDTALFRSTFPAVADFLERYEQFDVLPFSLDVLDTAGISPFFMDIYRALCAVSAGSTLTYGELAARAGRPKAARAAGMAMARNRFPVIIPCHRVVGRTSLVGFGPGLPMKEGMLTCEKAAAKG